MVRPKEGRTTTDPPPWYAPRYRNRGRLDEYLGDPQAHFLEILDVSFISWLNGYQSLDWSYEGCVVAIVRELGPGCAWPTSSPPFTWSSSRAFPTS